MWIRDQRKNSKQWLNEDLEVVELRLRGISQIIALLPSRITIILPSTGVIYIPVLLGLGRGGSFKSELLVTSPNWW